MIFQIDTLLTVITLVVLFDFSLLDWKNSDSSTSDPLDVTKLNNQKRDMPHVGDDITLISVPLEELSLEDKFFQEAERFSSVLPSGLDTCEQRVVLKIKTSCSKINEEELAKLSIKLLNCQSEVSGRSQVLCTDEMSLKECTSPMDSEIWNAYHIINNRARAVCYAARQQQFHALSEMTVQKLVSSALKQLNLMDSLEDLQKELNLLTTDTMSLLRDGQQGLVDQNSGMQLVQKKMKEDIEGNLKQLTQEKILILSTKDQLNSLSKKLLHQFGEATSQLNSQTEHIQHTQRQILHHLEDISHRVNVMWNLLGKKTQKVMQLQDKVEKETKETLERLQKINSTVNYLMNLVDQVKTVVEQHIALATAAIGEDKAILVLMLQHCLLLLVGLLVSLFLQLNFTCRLSLLVSVLVNIALVYKHRPLSLFSLSTTIVGSWIVSSIFPICWLAFKKYRATSDQRCTFSKEDDDEDDDKLSSKSENSCNSFNSVRNRKCNSEDNNAFSGLRYHSFPSNTDSRSQSMCAAVCRNGHLCRSTATPGRMFCKRHIAH